jgi:serine protease Do
MTMKRTSFSARAMAVPLIAIIFCATLAGCGSFGMSRPSDIERMLHKAQSKVFPTLVFLKPIRQQLGSGERVRQQIVGSGVIISTDGLVVTNSHVALDATEIKCVLFNSELLEARLIGLDLDTDLALLQIELPANHAPLPASKFGDSDKLVAGQFVMAFGSPYGLSRSVSLGIVSSPRRYLEVGPYSTWIQTDTAINPGNSGGPLVDQEGRIVGINTLKLSLGENIGFAIPSNTVKRIIEELRRNGQMERSYSGIQLLPLRDFIRDNILPGDTGVLAGGVDDLSPAASAGLKAGDLILKLNGKEIHGVFLEDVPGIRMEFASLRPNVPAAVTIRRGVETQELVLTPILKQTLSSEGLELEMWNCSVQEISKFRTPGLAYFVPRGVYVLGVRDPGNARASGLRAGDVILSVDGESVPTVEALQEVYRRLSRLDRGKRTALLRIQRGAYLEFIVLDFNRDYKQLGE